ncbi:hypothetical protein [Roseivirga misakiensis]|uniref:hypothetical protein n=1 Tax=Roseivirga misakiensis TaxID=1563681 RepID=UPI00114CB8D9|nr:hypothetical protein [Roseivirga misakiensis]
MPETSLFTLQFENTKKVSELITSQPWFEAVEQIPLISDLNKSIQSLDSLNEVGQLKSRLSQLPAWISMHTTSSVELTPLFIMKSEGFDWQLSSIQELGEKLFREPLTLSNQEFDGKEIAVLKSSELSFAVLIEGPYLVISENTILIEDVIRAMQGEESRLLKEGDVLKKSDILLIINSARLDELASVFVEGNDFSFSRTRMSGNVIVDLDIKDNELTFRGSEYNQSGLASNPSDVFGKNLIPLTSSSFSWRPNQVKLSELVNYFQNGFCTITIGRAQAQEQVYLMPVNDTTEVSNALRNMAQGLLAPSDSTVYKEKYISSEIGYINDEKFLRDMVEGLNNDAKAPFYTLFQNFLILSSNLDALKTVLDDFENESTWGRSIERRRILDDMIQETDLTYVQDFEYATDQIRRSLKPKWKQFFAENPEVLDVLNLFKVQLNLTGKSMLVAGNLSFRENFKSPIATDVKALEQQNILANVFTDKEIITKPYIVRNHNNSSLEIIFQDDANNLYLTNKQGEILWKKRIEGGINGKVHQVDYYKNRKLQYLFFTDTLIHLVDRNGDNVDGFPQKAIVSRPFVGSSVIDYANNKDYRFLAVDRRGDISLFDKQGELLEGWNPNTIGSPLLETPFHIRIRGRDCFVAVETSGRIHLINRKATPYDGFPIKVNGRFSGDIVIERGANFNQTFISLMTEEGEFIKSNFSGEIIQQKQFVRPSVNTVFTLVDDALETDFRVVRNDGRVLTFFDSELNETFSVDYPNSRNISVDFYNFRNGKEVFAIRDNDARIMRMVNRNGEFLTPIIPSNGEISMLFYQNRLEYEVFVNFANQMNIYAVKPL